MYCTAITCVVIIACSFSAVYKVAVHYMRKTCSETPSDLILNAAVLMSSISCVV